MSHFNANCAQGNVSSLLRFLIPNIQMAETPTNNDCIILYGTQTGTAEDLAEQLGEELLKQNVLCRIENMFDIEIDTVKEYKRLFVVVSTWGDGDPPDDAEEFHQEMSEAKDGLLKGTEFAVFGLGDTGYEQFCQCGIEFDNFLEKAGSKRILPRVDADIDFEEDFATWANDVQSKLLQPNLLSV